MESISDIDPESNMDLRNLFFEDGEISETENQVLKIKFSAGVPVALNDENMNMTEIIKRLNSLGKMFQVGYFVGLEQMPIGRKRLEIRTAPAAAILIKGHQAAESATLSENELFTKRHLEQQWVNLVSGGEWFSPLKMAIDQFMLDISKRVCAEVKVRLERGLVSIVSIQAQTPTYFTSKEEILISKVLENSPFEVLLKQILFHEPLSVKTLSSLHNGFK
jgi:argininosuccinate synthase